MLISRSLCWASLSENRLHFENKNIPNVLECFHGLGLGTGPSLPPAVLISANTRVPRLSTVHHPSPLDKGCLGAWFTGGVGATVARARVNCGQKRGEWVCCAVCNNHTSCLNQEAHGCTQESVEYRKPVCGNSIGSVPLALCHLSCWT